MLFGRGTAQRLTDHIEEQRLNRQQSREEHRELREVLAKSADRTDAAIKDLSGQLRGEVAAIRTEVNDRHTENRRYARWLMGAMVLAIVGIAGTYISAHGFRSPAISGDATTSTASSIKALKSLLEQILIEEKSPVRPGNGG